MELKRKYRLGCKAEGFIARDDLIAMFGSQNLHLDGISFLDGATTLDALAPNRIIFITAFTESDVATLIAADCDGILLIVTPAFPPIPRRARLICDAPRAAYTKIISRLFDYDGLYWNQLEAIHPSATVAPSARIMPGVIIGRHSSIGAGSVIYPNVVIGPSCSIGENCIVKSGSVIGQPGFGVFKNDSGRPEHFPHVGGVVIENDVEIGALNTICAGSIHPTVIGESAKLDDHVHIAHNCIVGCRTLVTACAEVSGSVVIGDDCWIGPNSSVIDGVTIGEKTFIGIGSNVTKPVPAGVVAVGNPARQIRKADR